jgi:DNA-binding NtrC family response regulator
LQDQVSLWERWFTTANIRWDDHQLAGPARTWRIASIYHLKETDTASSRMRGPELHCTRAVLTVAGAGAEGIERVNAGPSRVILLDLRLPDQYGLDVYQQIRKIDVRIPVIFITLAMTADAAIEAMKQGAYDYLFKPFEFHHLRRVVREFLDNSAPR